MPKQQRSRAKLAVFTAKATPNLRNDEAAKGETTMNVQAQALKAEQLRKLHRGPRMLVLPNAWDVISARIVEELGFPAIATTSAGIAATLGYPDGQKISREEMLVVVARIAKAVHVPVTADVEAGYGVTIDEMTQTVKAVVAAGAVGMNLEDVIAGDEGSQVDLALQVEKIRAIRRATESLGVPLVLNARTDIYLIPIGAVETRFDRTVERLRAYREAGADCLFAPGLKNPDTIAKLVRAVNGPLNILLMPGMPTLRELENMGVARASAGSGVMRATLGLTRRIAKEMLEAGTYASMLEGTVPFAEVNELLAREKS
jgi:2-methylisocitrate lyase-like PEP mutase family enzyme